MKQIIAIIATALLVAGCCNQSKVETKQTPDSCITNYSEQSSLDLKQRCSNPDSLFSPEIWTSEWMRQYAEYARSYDTFYKGRIMDIWDMCSLCYIDDDTIPEIVFFDAAEAYGTRVLTYYNGKVVEWNSWRNYATYIPKSGLIENKNGQMGDYWDIVYQLKNGTFTQIYNHSDILIQGIGEGRNRYYCIFNGDTTIRIGDEMNCRKHDKQKRKIYSSVGKSVALGENQKAFPSKCFE